MSAVCFILKILWLLRTTRVLLVLLHINKTWTEMLDVKYSSVTWSVFMIFEWDQLKWLISLMCWLSEKTWLVWKASGKCLIGWLSAAVWCCPLLDSDTTVTHTLQEYKLIDHLSIRYQYLLSLYLSNRAAGVCSRQSLWSNKYCNSTNTYSLY